VLATQNPIESEGTYNLPEAQIDRFMFKLAGRLSARGRRGEYPPAPQPASRHQPRLEEELATVTSPEEIVKITRQNGDIHVDDRLIDYINKIVRVTRQWPQFTWAPSPRAGIALMQGARTLAAFSAATTRA